MNESLVKALRETHNTQHKLWFWTQVIEFGRAVVTSLVVVGLWAFIVPGFWPGLAVFFLSLLLLFYYWYQKPSKKVAPRSILISLESQHRSPKRSAFELLEKGSSDTEWKGYLEQHVAELQERAREALKNHFQKLVLPLAALALFLIQFPDTFSLGYQSVRIAVAKLSETQYMEILDGAYTEVSSQINLSSSIQEFKLHEKNRIKIVVVDERGQRPFIELHPKNGTEKLSFSLSPINEHDTSTLLQTYELAFNVPEDADVFLSTVSLSDPVLRIDVEKLPVPVVSLQAVMNPLPDPWPDERPVKLRIKVTAENPIRMVRLKIKSEGQEYEELVSNVLAEDKYLIETDYNLLLESYVQQDLSNIELVAEAIDKAVPKPLIGRSRPLVINTASAYGRYQKTLNTLREIKSRLDATREQGLKEIEPDAPDLMRKAIEQAGFSPFFDSLDRMNLRKIQAQIESLAISVDEARLAVASDSLNRFLFDHETVDDRERDRDFFIATRTLSRILEEKVDKRNMPADLTTERMKNFLAERMVRWKKRVEHLGGDDKAPKQWKDVSRGKFDHSLSEIGELSKTDAGSRKSLLELSELVSDYREWVAALEKVEDETRKKQDQERQKNLADLKQELKKLQRQQSKISSKLDRASEQDQKQLSEQWGSIRMDQNGNIQKSNKVEAKLRSLSPNASERMRFAIEMMKMTIKSGNDENFVQAETASDAAGRALRDASKAPSQGRKSRGRRRRVGSDESHGQSVLGGDVKILRGYQVDRRYREVILEDVNRVQENSENRELLDNYLRKVIR